MEKRKPQILTFGLLIALAINVKAQERINLSAGFSFPEGYNLGCRYKYNLNKRVDFFYGFSQPFDMQTNWNSFSLNHAFYFGKVRQKTNHKPWTINTGFLLAITNLPTYQDINGFINLYFARELVISRKIFIELKLGLSYLLFYDVKKGFVSGYIIRFIPNFGINLGIKV